MWNMPETWFIVYAEKDSSYSLVPHTAILTFEDVSVGDTVTFFYGNKSFIGNIVARDEDREKMNAKLTQFKAKVKRAVKPKSLEVSGKREVKKRERFCPVPTPSTSESKTRKRKSAEAVKAKRDGTMAMNAQVLKLNEDEDSKDSSYVPGSPEHSDEDDFLVDKQMQKKKKSILMKVVKSPLSDSEDDLETKDESIESVEELEQLMKSTQAKIAALKGKQSDSNGKGASKLDVEHEDFLDIGYQSEGGSRPSTSKQVKPNVAVSLLSPNESISPKQEDKDGSLNEESKADSSDALDSPKDGNIVFSDLYQSQLYGKHYSGDVMVHIGKNIYCKQSALSKCESAMNPKQVARRLLTGVFIEEKMLACTLTGQKPRAAGKEHYEGEAANKKIDDLCPTAINAMIDYIVMFTNLKKWDAIKDKQVIRNTITQRVGEIKRKLRARTVAGGNESGAAGGEEDS